MKKRFSPLKAILAAAVFAALCGPATAQGLRSRVDEILASPKLQGAQVSLRIIEMPNGRVLYSSRAEETLSVASNAKLVTVAAALDLLGGDFELTTTLVAAGKIAKGTLHGDLVIVGRGDPSMSEHWYGRDVMAPMRRLAAEVRAAGITAVTGDLLANDLYFDRRFWCASWPTNQWIHWYQAPVGALAFNDNCVDALVGPGASAGAPARVKIHPDVGYISLLNLIKTTSSLKEHRKRGFGFYRNKTANGVSAKGRYYLKASPSQTNFTVYDPSLYTAAAMAKALGEAGVSIGGATRRMTINETGKLDGARVLGVHRVKLAEVVKFCNLNSQNLYAEMLLKTLGREVEGEGSFSGGAKAVSRFLEKVGLKPGEYTVADGSGLSRETKFSAMGLTRVLKHMYGHSEVNAFRDSLPLSGYAGSLASRLTEEPYLGKVRAKTGYILGVSALSGYALTSNGKTVAFSMVFNGFKGSNRYTIKPVQDDVCRAIVDSSP